MQGSPVGVGVRREGWALHNLFSLNLIKGNQRERGECGNAVDGRRGAALSPSSSSLLREPAELGATTPVCQLGKGGTEEGG